MRKNFTSQLLATFALAASLVQADKITLKDGTILEGEVVDETDTEYVIAVAFSKSIKTRKTYKKSDVVDIEKEAPDLKPYEALKGIIPTPDRLSEKAYEQLIEARVKPFLSSYPNSKHAKEVKAMLETLEAELERVKVGDLKLDGKWIAAAEWNANALELDGQLHVKRMKALAARQSYRPALLIYDKLFKEFRATAAQNDAADLAAKFLPSYSAQIKKLAAESTGKIEKRKKALAAMGSRDANRMKKAYDEETKKHDAAVAAAKEARIKWLPVSEYNTRDLKALAIVIDQEIGALKRQATRSIRDTSTGDYYRKGWDAASVGDVEETKRALSNLKSRRVDEKYLTLISEQLAANPAPEKKTGPTAADLKAAADKKAAEEAEAKAAEEKKKAEEAEKEKLRKQREAEENEDDEPVEESSSSVLPIIIAIALLGVLIAFLVIQRKQSEE